MQIEIINRLLAKFNLGVDLKQAPNKREKLIFIAAIIVFVVVFFRSCWGPSVSSIGSIKGEIDLAKEQNAYLSQLVNASTESEEQAFRTDAMKQAQYSDWAKRLANDPDAVLVGDFSNPNILRDIKINNINFQETASAGGLIKKGFKLSLVGSFASVGDYLVKMEDLPLLLSLDSVNIKTAGADKGSTGQSRVYVDIEGVAYGWK